MFWLQQRVVPSLLSPPVLSFRWEVQCGMCGFLQRLTFLLERLHGVKF